MLAILVNKLPFVECFSLPQNVRNVTAWSLSLVLSALTPLNVGFLLVTVKSISRVCFTQKQVALALGMSERGVREAERRALEKLRHHPLLQHIWQQYQRGQWRGV
jgi:hypothetical protein